MNMKLQHFTFGGQLWWAAVSTGSRTWQTNKHTRCEKQNNFSTLFKKI